MRKFKSQVSYLRLNTGISYFEKKSFSAKMIRDDPIVFISSFRDNKANRNKTVADSKEMSSNEREQRDVLDKISLLEFDFNTVKVEDEEAVLNGV